VTVTRVEVGFVTGAGLVEFYRDVFGLTEIEPRSFPMGTLRRLEAGPGVLKFLTPVEPAVAAPVEPGPFWRRRGLQYVALWLDHLDGISASAVARGGSVVQEPTEIRPGVFTMLLLDPDGNTVEVMADAGAPAATAPGAGG